MSKFKKEDPLHIALDALSSIACDLDDNSFEKEEVWLHQSHERCVEVILTDTKIAREALKKIRAML